MAASAIRNTNPYGIFIWLACILLYSKTHAQSTPPPAHTDYTRTGAPMPPFLFMSYNDTSSNFDRNLIKKKYPKDVYKKQTDTTGKYTFMTAGDFDNGANLLIMVFNPLCSHCEDVVFIMEKNIKAFKKVKLVLLASKVMDVYLPDFTERHHIAHYPPMLIGYDSSRYIDNILLYQPLPQINIYDANRKLIKIFTGEVSMDTLKKYINYNNDRKRKKKAQSA